jgi:3-hydroxyacyl-[acyl-carrier-protein] dehydratase
MPPPPILDPAKLDLENPIHGPEKVEQVNPHRFEFRLIDGIVHMDAENLVYAGFHNVRSDAFWVRGHIPGRPLFPGVLMIEAAAQLASFMHHSWFASDAFLGFIGVDKVKFRGVVQPPSRLVLVGRGKVMKPNRMLCDSQGFVGGTMVFEGEISGRAV